MAARSHFLDSLRAFAIISVLGAHYFPAVFPGAAVGVSVFFALSGFLIADHLLKQEVIDWGATWRFWVRRFFRVYPAFFLTACVSLLLMWWLGHPQFPNYLRAFVGLVTFTSLPTQFIAMVPGVFWTLFIEFWFYATIPLIMMLMGRGNRLPAFLVAIAILSFLCVLDVNMGLFRFSDWWGHPPGGVFPWIGQLIYGALAALAVRRMRRFTVKNEQFVWISRGCLGAIALLMLFVSNDDRDVAWPLSANAVAILTAITIIAWSLSIFEIKDGILPFIGRISYSLYLVHAIPIDYLGSIPWPAGITLAHSKPWGLIVASLVVATAMHYLVELPFQKIGRRLIQRASSGRRAVEGAPQLGQIN